MKKNNVNIGEYLYKVAREIFGNGDPSKCPNDLEYGTTEEGLPTIHSKKANVSVYLTIIDFGNEEE